MKHLLDKLFPLRQMRNVALFYVLSAVYNAWFVAGVWVFIWGVFMTKSEMGVSDVITFTIGFLVELPSGALADMVGRRKIIIIGNVLLMLGNLLVASSSSFFTLTASYLIWTIGYAFQSGATEALVYDGVKAAGREHEWHKIIATSTIVAKLTTLIATAVGGMIFLAWFRLPYIVASLVGVIGVIAALMLKEVRVQTKVETWSTKEYVMQVRDGLSVLVRRSILPIALLCLSMISIAYMYNWGLLRPLTAERFGYTPERYSFLLSAISLAAIVAATIFTKLQRRFKTESLLLVLGAVYSLLFFTTAFNHSWWLGGMLMAGLAVVILYIELSFSQFINHHTEGKHRATTLSAVALFTRLPYVLLAVVIGKVADQNLMPQYMGVVGIAAMGIWLVAAVMYAKTTKYALVSAQ